MTGGSRVLLAFLDVITCGLGAAILLFMVYVALPHKDAGTTGTDAANAGAGKRTPTGAPQASLPMLNGASISIRAVDVDVPEGVDQSKIQGDWVGIPKGKHAPCKVERGFERRVKPPHQLTFLLTCLEPIDITRAHKLQISAPDFSSLDVSAIAYQGAFAVGAPGGRPLEGVVATSGPNATIVFLLSDRRRPIRIGGT